MKGSIKRITLDIYINTYSTFMRVCMLSIKIFVYYVNKNETKLGVTDAIPDHT